MWSVWYFSVNTKTEPKIPKPNFLVPCLVPNSQQPVLYLWEPNLPNYMKCAEFKYCYIIDSTILVNYIICGTLYSLVYFYMYVFGIIILYEIMSNLCQN